MLKPQALKITWVTLWVLVQSRCLPISDQLIHLIALPCTYSEPSQATCEQTISKQSLMLSQIHSHKLTQPWMMTFHPAPHPPLVTPQILFLVIILPLLSHRQPWTIHFHCPFLVQNSLSLLLVRLVMDTLPIYTIMQLMLEMISSWQWY